MSSLPLSRDRVLAPDNIELSSKSGRGMGLIAAGVILIGVTIAACLAGTEENHLTTVALHAFHMGALMCIGFSTAALGAVMIFHQFNAGWMATMRRQFENVMCLIWVGAALMAISFLLQFAASFKDVWLFHWMEYWLHPEKGDDLFHHKAAFLNVPFFVIRAFLYFAVWGGLATLLWSYSRKQDVDGDKWHTAHARKLSAIGIVIWGFTVAFAAFDWIMTLDYHWFSTMFGVYFFAGNMVSMFALTLLIFLGLRSRGKLHGAYTREHLHDHSKLLFAFVVFWAYITFSQYFLIWYANIPEETSFFIVRKEPGTLWRTLSIVIPIGHFIVPFVWLMAKPAKRSFLAAGIAAVLILIMHTLDLYWMIRPQAHHAPEFTWLDVVGVLGPVALFVGVLIRRIGSVPLVGVNDPRIPEGLHHKNYV